ncbi:MAG TPA: 50S ribosomal protein L25, partial [bacterium]
MKDARLEVSLRESHGKGGARKLRATGNVPGVIYGINKPVNIQANTRMAGFLVQALHGSTRLINLTVKNNGKSEDKHVLLKAVQVTPVGQKLVHLDFQEVDITKNVQVLVEVRPEGVAEGIKQGGVLQTVTYELMVECLPTAIPDFIPVNVEALKIGGSLHVKEIKLPAGVK